MIRVNDSAQTICVVYIESGLPSLRFGEKRIAIDAAICPELHKGLVTAMRVICNWYDWYSIDKNLVQIEGKKQQYIPDAINGKRAGFLFSGGIDSFALTMSIKSALTALST